MTTSDDTASIDLATVIAISVLAYTIANVVHEGLGHGGATLLSGARPTMFNAIFFRWSRQEKSRGNGTDRPPTPARREGRSAAGAVSN